MPWPWRPANAITLEVADSEKFLSNIAYTCQQLYPKPKLLIVNYPHNPSTVTVEPEFFVEVVKLANRYGFMVISDFAYADVAFDGYQPPSFLAAPGAIDVGVEFTTMSKGYNMAGWRVGFCAGNAEMVKALGTIKTYYDYGMFQADPDRRDHGPAAYRSRRRGPERPCIKAAATCCATACAASAGRSRPPGPACSSGPRFPTTGRSQMDTMTSPRSCWKKADVAVSPGTGFGPAGEGYLRLALVENENRLRQAVRQIARCLGGDAGRPATPARSSRACRIRALAKGSVASDDAACPPAGFPMPAAVRRRPNKRPMPRARMICKAARASRESIFELPGSDRQR